MKQLDIENMRIVQCGEPWPHAQPPSSKDMMRLLERNEKYVTWLQPRDCDSIEEQVPALFIDGAYYLLSLRMMKCVWRHVRLSKKFVNSETALYGGRKLMIPMSLYAEKIRTQKRFNNMRMEQHQPSLAKRASPGASMFSLSSSSASVSKSNLNASAKVTSVVQKILFPLVHAPVGSSVSFHFTDDESTCSPHSLLRHLQESQPDKVRSKDAFIQLMSEAYDAAAVHK